MKILGQSRSDRKYEENLRKSGGDDLALQQARQAYYDSISFEELFSYIRNLLNMPDLELSSELYPRPQYAIISIRSNNISKTNNILSLAFRECTVGTGTSSLVFIENLEEYENGAEPFFKTQFRIDLLFESNTGKVDSVKLFTASYSESKNKWKFNEIKR